MKPEDMTLRDWFAGMAQTHLKIQFYAKVYAKGKKEHTVVEMPCFEWSDDTIQKVTMFEARYAYAVADAMLKAREPQS